MIITVIGSRTD